MSLSNRSPVFNKDEHIDYQYEFEYGQLRVTRSINRSKKRLATLKPSLSDSFISDMKQAISQAETDLQVAISAWQPLPDNLANFQLAVNNILTELNKWRVKFHNNKAPNLCPHPTKIGIEIKPRTLHSKYIPQFREKAGDRTVTIEGKEILIASLSAEILCSRVNDTTPTSLGSGTGTIYLFEYFERQWEDMENPSSILYTNYGKNPLEAKEEEEEDVVHISNQEVSGAPVLTSLPVCDDVTQDNDFVSALEPEASFFYTEHSESGFDGAMFTPPPSNPPTFEPDPSFLSAPEVTPDDEEEISLSGFSFSGGAMFTLLPPPTPHTPPNSPAFEPAPEVISHDEEVSFYGVDGCCIDTFVWHRGP